jgi:hypothetical protein
MSIKGTKYQSYLLRLWSVEVNGTTAWRASLEHVRTGERCNFSSLEGLFLYIEQATRDAVTANQGELNEKIFT